VLPHDMPPCIALSYPHGRPMHHCIWSKMTKFVVVVFWEFFPKMGCDRQHTGSVMRILDDRCNRERLCLDLALRFLRHEARTQTLRTCGE
jgi:hypothetical protein